MEKWGGQLDIRPPNLQIGGDVSPLSPPGLTPLAVPHYIPEWYFCYSPYSVLTGKLLFSALTAERFFGYITGTIYTFYARKFDLLS